MKVAGFEIKDEERDEEDKEVDRHADNEDGNVIEKQEWDEDTQVKGETSPSPSQVGDQEQPERDYSPNVPMADADSDRESEMKLESAEAQERFDGNVYAKVDSGDSEGSESSSDSESS